MFQGITPTKFGRFQTAPPMQLHRLHVHDGSQLKEVEHTIPIPVLDQEDLFAQAIDTSVLIPGAQRVDALGSCTCNAGTAHLAERTVAAGKDLPAGLSASDAVADEEYAIRLYHAVTDQTGNPSTEWPPTDCGSSGYYVCTEFEHQGLAVSYKSASTVLDALSLLQSGTVMQGAPWFSAWMTPDSDGFVDGDGGLEALYEAVKSGVAGGHETLQWAIPQLAVTKRGEVDLRRTVIKVRNSWSSAFALGGDYLIHASTLAYLAQYVDYKQAVVA